METSQQGEAIAPQADAKAIQIASQPAAAQAPQHPTALLDEAAHVQASRLAAAQWLRTLQSQARARATAAGEATPRVPEPPQGLPWWAYLPLGQKLESDSDPEA